MATPELLLREHHGLVQARSTREHRGTLLHYVGAKGVEDYRQKSPRNAVQVAEMLLKAGAEVDTALADGASTTMGLVATSVHTARSGVQVALIETLLDHGASVDGIARGWSPLMAALANHCPDAAVALGRRGARVDNIIPAAGLGRLDLVRSYVNEGGSLKEAVAAITYWGIPRDPKE